jgi:sulfur carrier protein ThiS adenylyltransferase
MAGFDCGNSIQTRKITDKFYLSGDGVSDVNGGIGLVAPRVMLCAAHQAMTAIRLILGLV